MPTYYTPGVYIEEVNTGPRPIEAVQTAVAAFVGFAPAGPVGEATLITSWTQFVETFGARNARTGQKDPFIADAYLAHAVDGFFLNGGSRSYVVGVLPASFRQELTAPALAIHTAKARGEKREEPLLLISPKKATPPAEGPARSPSADIHIALERTAGTSPDDELWTVRLAQGEIREDYTHISWKPAAPPADDQAGAAPKGKKDAGAAGGAGNGGASRKPTTLEDLSNASRLVTIVLADKAGEDRIPATGLYHLDVPQPDLKVLATVAPSDIVGDPLAHTGVVGLELADDVTMVCCPDLMSPLAYPEGKVVAERVKIVQMAMINHCDAVGGRMALLDAPPKLKPQAMESWRLDPLRANHDSMHAALYYPWINVANPRAGEKNEPATLTVPPCGHVAGIYARNDSERGVHKAPANEVVRGALGPALEVSNGEQAGLNQIGVNCIRSFRGRGVRVWGARTLTSDPAWRYINVRRLFNMVEKSIERDTQWVVFEPNDPGLWSRVRRDVTAFLMTLWRDGMLFGNTPDEAFFVKCDEELNPPESRDLGRLIIEVGMAPVKPAEFVIFRFSQYSGGGQ